MPPILDLIFLAHGVPETDFLRAIQTEIRLFIEGRGTVGVGWYVGVLEGEALFCGLCEAGSSAAEGSQAGEGWMGGWEERHCASEERPQLSAVDLAMGRNW